MTRPWLIVSLGALCLAIPVLAFPAAPMTDLPLHEGTVALLRSLVHGDGLLAPPGLYRLNLGHQNQLLAGLILALASVPAISVHAATTAMTALSVAAVPLTGAALAAHLGRRIESALVLATVAMGWLFYWGLLSNLLSVSVLLMAAVAFDRHLRAPDRRGAAWACGAMLLVYAAHGTAFVAAMAMYGVLGLAWAPRTVRPLSRWGYAALPPSFGVAVYALEWVRQRQLMPPALRAQPNVFDGWQTKLLLAPGYLVGGFEPSLRHAMLASAVIAVVAWRLPSRGARAQGVDATASVAQGTRSASWVERHRFFVVTAALLGLYAVMPQTLDGATLVYPRFLSFAWAMFVVAMAPAAASSPGTLADPLRLVRWALLGMIPLATLVLGVPMFAEATRAAAEVQPLLDAVAPRSAVALLELARQDPWRPFATGSMSYRVLAQRGGRISYSFTDSPISPAYLDLPFHWDEYVRRCADYPLSFRPAHDFRRFAFALVHVEDVSARAFLARAMQPEGTLAGVSGQWMLFASALPTLALTSPDEPLPSPAPESLRKRLDAAGAGVWVRYLEPSAR